MSAEGARGPKAAANWKATGGQFDLDAWRNLVTDRLLLSISALGTILAIYFFVQAFREPQRWSQAVPVLIVYGLLLALLLLRRWIAYHIRAWVLLLVGYAAAAMLLANLGLLGTGVALLVVLPALALIILGRSSGIIAALLSLVTYAAFTVAAATGTMADWLAVRENTLELVQWLAQGLLAGLILAGLWMLLERFLHGQVAALAEARASAEDRAVVSGVLQERTKDLTRYIHLLELVAEISREVSSVRESGRVLQQAVDLLAERLELERVAVYLVAEEGSARGPDAPVASHLVPGPMAGRRPEVEDGDGVAPLTVGEPATEIPAEAMAMLARTAGAQGARSTAEIIHSEGGLPEVMLPLYAGGTLLAVLHIVGPPAESGGEAATWREEEVGALDVLADQLAAALENARLFDEAEARLLELNALQRHYTADAWQRFVELRGQAAYHWSPLRSQITGAEGGPVTVRAPGSGLSEDVWRSLFERVQAEGRPVDLLHDDSGQHILAVPVRLRDALIAMLGFYRPRDAGSWQPQEIAAIEVVASRMAFAAENLRLLEDAQRRAARDRLIEEIASQVQASLDPDNILKTAVRELGRALEADWASIEVTGPEEVG